MRSGVSFPSYAASATFAMASGSAHVDYPVTNLASLKEISRPFRASAPGAIAITGVLAADQAVEFVGLVKHNAEAGETYRIRCYSDAGLSSLVDDSGALTFTLDPKSRFSKTAPYVLPASMTVRSVRIDLSAQTAAWQLGGVEIAGFFDFTDAGTRDLGLQAQDTAQDVGEGVFHLTSVFSPRLVNTGRQAIDWTVDGAQFLDFQNATGLSEPFVWVRDYADPTTWPREAVLVRNAELVAMTKGAGILGDYSMRFQEHLW